MFFENVSVPFLIFSHQAQPYFRFLSVLSFETILIFKCVQMSQIVWHECGPNVVRINKISVIFEFSDSIQGSFCKS